MRPEAGPQEPSAAELAKARAERDAAVEKLDQYEGERSKVRRHRTRRVVAVALVVLFVVLLPITVASTWAHRTVLDTDTYVSTVAPIAADDAVTAAVSRDITNQIYAALDPQAVIAGALPPRAAFLAGPVASAAKTQVQQAVDAVLSSAEFQRLWSEANRFAHSQLVTVLRGNTSVLQTTEGQVVLNLVPLLSAALERASDFVAGVIGRPVSLPAVSSDELPSRACARISAAIDRQLPETCGQVALFPSDDLTTAQRAVRAFDRGVVALLVIVPVLFAAALLVSPRRRRTLLQLTIGGMAGLVLVRRVLFWEQDNLVDTGRAGNEDARRAIVHGLLDGFFDLTVWFLVGGLVLVALALVTGPYRWAVAARARAATTGRLTALAVRGGDTTAAAEPRDVAALGWVRRRFDVLRVGGAVVGVLLLLVVDVNVWGFLVVAGLVAAYELALHRLRPPPEITLPAPPPGVPTSV